MEKVESKSFYSPEEFRNILGCSRHICYEALHQNKIRSFRLGKKYFIPASAVERLTQLAAAENDSAPSVDADLW